MTRFSEKCGCYCAEKQYANINKRHPTKKYHECFEGHFKLLGVENGGHGGIGIRKIETAIYLFLRHELVLHIFCVVQFVAKM